MLNYKKSQYCLQNSNLNLFFLLFVNYYSSSKTRMIKKKVNTDHSKRYKPATQNKKKSIQIRNNSSQNTQSISTIISKNKNISKASNPLQKQKSASSINKKQKTFNKNSYQHNIINKKYARNTTPYQPRNILSSLSNQKSSLQKYSCQNKTKSSLKYIPTKIIKQSHQKDQYYRSQTFKNHRIQSRKNITQKNVFKNGKKQTINTHEKDLKVIVIKKQKNTKPNKEIQIDQSRQIRKSVQSCGFKSKSKSQSKKIKKQKQLLKKRQLLNLCKNEKSLTRSFFTSKDISKNNSLQKNCYDSVIDVNRKFNKQKGQKKNKLKKQNKYCSTKISQRNSSKLIDIGENQFVFIGKNINPQNCEHIRKDKTLKYDNINKIKGLNKQKNYNKKQNIGINQQSQNYSKSILNLNSLKIKLKQNLQNQCNEQKAFKKLKNSIKDRNQSQNFSFFQNVNDKKQNFYKQRQNSNIHEISLDRFLFQNDDSLKQKSFVLQCEQSLKQRISKIQQQSLQQLKQLQFDRLSQIQSLNSFQNSLQRQNSYSISKQILQLALNNTIDFKQINYLKSLNDFRRRIQIVDWMSMLCSTMLFKNQTFHLSVCYYDIYVNQAIQNVKQDIAPFKLIALGCLMLSIKMDDRQYQYDILNALTTLQFEYSRKQIVDMQQQIFRKFKSKLKIQTVSFYFNYFSQKWDNFLMNQNHSLQNKQNLFIRSIQGKSYENYRKITAIVDAILLDKGIFIYQMIDISLATIYIVLIEQAGNIQREKSLERIKHFQNKQNLNQMLKNQLFLLSQSTQQTLNELQQNPSTKDSQTIVQIFQQTFIKFVQQFSKIKFHQLKSVIEYVKKYSQMKINLEINTRSYEEAQTYEQFVRCHYYSPFSKIFVLKKIDEEFCEDNTKNSRNPNQSTLNQREQRILKQKQLNSTNKVSKQNKQNEFHIINFQCNQIAQFQNSKNATQKPFNQPDIKEKQLSRRNQQKNQNIILNSDKFKIQLDYFLNQEVDQIFTEQQIRHQSIENL